MDMMFGSCLVLERHQNASSKSIDRLTLGTATQVTDTWSSSPDDRGWQRTRKGIDVCEPLSRRSISA